MKQPDMTLVAAAARLLVSWHTAHRWVLTGVLKGHQRDGRWYVDPKDLRRFEKQRNGKSEHRGS